MKPDLIFYLVSKRKWKENQKYGYYYPEVDAKNEIWIRCYLPEEVEERANRLFSGRKRILLLVIHANRVSEKFEYREENGSEVPMIKNRINLDAVIDKIQLDPNEEGRFDIKIE